MKRKLSLLLTFVLLFVCLLGQSVGAFQDIKDKSHQQKIEELKEAGIINGLTDKVFGPEKSMNYSQATALIVRGLDLNIDHMRFIKEPKASDYFTKISDRSWYANAFMVAHLNGLDIEKNVNPNQAISREEFAHLLVQAILTTGDYAFIEIFIMIEDEEEINTKYMNSIQKLLIMNLTELDSKQQFHPKKSISRLDAALWLYQGIQFVKEQKENQVTPPTNPDEPVTNDQVVINTDKVNNQVNKVTLSWGEKPNSGYMITISKIEFNGKEAIIYYELHEPQPGKMYSQVITYPKVDTYISAEYKPVLKRAK